jgi:hypothetical protein
MGLRFLKLAAVLAVIVPVCALSGVTLVPGTGADAGRPAAQPPAPGLYQIRCWQHGRLLFEDRISLPAQAAAYGVRMTGTDRQGRPLYMAETHNATCLVRIVDDTPAWPR